MVRPGEEWTSPPARPEGKARTIDILIPTYERPAALAVTLTSLAFHGYTDYDVVISDQSETCASIASGEVQAAVRLLRHRGHAVDILHHVPRRGIAEQRQFLLDQARAPHVLFIDDDLILEPYLAGTLLGVLRREGCGFAGSALIGLSYREDVRPHEQTVEFWSGPVEPETVTPGSPAWERYPLHNAANILHVQRALGLTPDSPRAYRVAWVGGCVLYDTGKLRACGGFSFWRELPEAHCGEDVLVQLRVMSRFGGCGVMPAGAYHQELPTTLPDRSVVAPRVLPVEP
jgi:GT2 family glycosyltransferase